MVFPNFRLIIGISVSRRGRWDVHDSNEAPRQTPPAGQDIDRYIEARARERRIMLGLTQQQKADLNGFTYQQALYPSPPPLPPHKTSRPSIAALGPG